LAQLHDDGTVPSGVRPIRPRRLRDSDDCESPPFVAGATTISNADSVRALSCPAFGDRWSAWFRLDAVRRARYGHSAR
jgi:hypothetical protein